MKRWKQIEILVIGSYLFFYAVAASLVSLHRYWQFDAFWLDFGIFDETIWRLSRFELPIIPNLAPPLGKIVWADHLNPSAVLLAPLYWLSGRAEVILIAQVVVVVLSALVAYQIARKVIRHPLVRIALVVSYLGFVGLQNALYTDVHNIVFALLPLTLTTWALYERKWKWYFVFLMVTLGFQENLAAVGAGLGLFVILRQNRYIKVGVLTILLSLIWGLFAYFVIIPYFNGGPYRYQPDVPTVWYEWVTRFFSRDLKSPTIIYTFLSFGVVPLGSLAVFPLILEHFLERFVLNLAATRWDLGFHYNALLSPIMFLATVDVLERLQRLRYIKKWLPLWALGTIATVVVLHRFILHGPLMLATHPVFYEQTRRNEFIRKFADRIPTDGLLMTQNNLAAHFTHHRVVLLSPHYAAYTPDTVAIDIRPGQNANNFYPLTQAQVEGLVASLSADPNYHRQEFTDTQLIFRRR